MNLGSVEICIESLSAHRAVEKLSRGGVEVLSAENPQKNRIVLRVAARDMRKSFAILRGACYNIKGVRPRGLARAKEILIRSAGLLVGAVFFAVAVFFAMGRVLKVEIVGSGAYYEREVRAILKEEGVGFFSPLPKSSGAVTARILSLPRVEFCSLSGVGGVLTVRVECAEELEVRPALPLLSPADGTLEELIVLRGTPLVSVGERVSAGQELVSPAAEGSAVIATATVSFPVSREYALGEGAARAQAFLDFGEISALHMTKTSSGWLVEGVARKTAACGLG